jgi:hypothetical protein
MASTRSTPTSRTSEAPRKAGSASAQRHPAQARGAPADVKRRFGNHGVSIALSRRAAAGDDLNLAGDVDTGLVQGALEDKLRQAIARVLTALPDSPDLDLKLALAATVRAELAGLVDEAQVGHGAEQASEIAVLTAEVDLPSGGVFDIPDVLVSLDFLHSEAAGGSSGAVASASVRQVIRVLSADAATSIVAALPEGPSQLSMLAIRDDLAVAAAAMEDATALLRLELEGTISELVTLRQEFAVASDEEARKQTGGALSQTARRALLLNDTLLKAAKGRTGPTPLDTAVEARAADIARIRATAVTEDATKEALGGGIGLLTEAAVTIRHGETEDQPAYLLGERAEDIVLPEEAFPATIDAAEKSFAGQMASRVKKQRAELAGLRNRVVPEHPTYELPEFADVHRRWYGLYSQAQEKQDPMVQMVLELMGEPYSMLGMDVGGAALQVEGGFARSLLMSMSVDILSKSLSGETAQFARQVRAGRPTRRTETSGTADAPDFNYGEMYPLRPGESPAPPSPEGEVRSRANYEARRREETAAAFTVVAGQPDEAAQRAAAKEKGLTTDSGTPLVGMHQVQAQEGWSYLVDVYSRGGQPVVIAREHKVVAPEVAAYLLAARQQQQALAATHVAKAAGKPLGSAFTRGGGVEEATGTSEARYVRGEATPKAPDEVTALRGQLTAARAESGLRPGAKLPQEERLVAQLQGNLRAYLDAFFGERQSVEWRLAAVFVIGNAEHKVGDQLMALLEPKNLAKMIGEALKISAIMMVLQALGPLGAIAARGYQAYLSSQGVSNVGALISIAAFCKNAADADSLDRARAWGYMTRYIADDAAELFETLVTTPVTSGLHALTEAKPNTPRELADAVRPLMDDPGARESLMKDLDADIARRESGDQDRTDPELEGLKAFRDSLLGWSAIDTAAAAEAEVPGAKTEAIGAEFFIGRKARSEADKAALNGALGDLAGLVPITEGKGDGNAVRVRYDDEGKVWLEVERGVEPKHVRRHVETVRQLRRYEGVVGRIRQLLSRIRQLITGKPAYGTLGHEARLEVDKLNAIIADLETQLEGVEARSARLTRSERIDKVREGESIRQEIEALEEQLAHHEANVDSYEAGRGFVAAEDTTKKSATEKQIEDVKNTQRQAYLEAEFLRRIYDRMAAHGRMDLSLLSPTEREHLNYLAGHVHESGDAKDLTLTELRELPRTMELAKDINVRIGEEKALVEKLRQESIPLYDKMRAASPNSASTRVIIGGAHGLDFASGKMPGSGLGALDVDHIVPLKEIVYMPGFRDLHFDDQLALVNDVKNLRAIDSKANRSRSDWSWADWPDRHKYYDEPALAKMRALEDSLRTYLAGRIASLPKRK